MQVFIIILAIVTLFADHLERLGGADFEESTAALRIGATVAAFAPLGVILIGATWLGLRRIDRAGSRRVILRLELLDTIAAWMGLGILTFAIAKWGYAQAVREMTGDLVLLDEVLIMAPALALLILIWCCQFPIYRRIREADLLRRLDLGQEVRAPLRLRGYLLHQGRFVLVLILLPILGIIGWVETVDRLWPADWSRGWAEVVTLLGIVLLFVIAPAVIVRLWATTELPPGSLRERIERIGRDQRVRIGSLRIWHTSGEMANAAVMGIFGRVRTVLMTDRLLASLPEAEIEAVMAHELGHVRRKHLAWLALCMLAILASIGLGVGVAVEAIIAARAGGQSVEPMSAREIWQSYLESMFVLPEMDAEGEGLRVWLETAGLAVTLVVGLTVFGWVSRRFERQADTFAVQHLSGARVGQRDAAAVITPEAAETMSSALRHVAALNAFPIRRFSWRHGSIDWRIRYLRSLVGRRADSLPIDRMIAWLKAGTALLLAVLALAWYGMAG